MPAFWRTASLARNIVAVAAVSIASAAFAQSSVPNFMMTWDASNDSVGPNAYNWGQFGTLQDMEGDVWRYFGSLEGSNNLWDLEWDCSFDADPFIVSNIVVTNNDIVDQEFNLLMTLPISPAVPNPIISGSIVGTLTNLAAGGSATVSAVPGDSIYTALIDGSVEERLMNPDLSAFSTTVTGPFVSGPVGPQSFGPIAGSQNADTSIGLRLRFVLSPGDSASFTSIFEVVPAPASLPLLVGFGLLAGGRRRRH